VTASPLIKKILALCLCAASLALSGLAQAQSSTFPNRPIKVILGYAPGGSTDAFGRYYVQKLSEVLNTPVVIDFKPGAGQILAFKTVQAAPADGYTLWLGAGSAFSQGPGIRNDLPYDPLKDMVLIGMAATSPGVIVVSANLPVNNVRELTTYSKANPGKLNYGSSGVGSASHLQSAYLVTLTEMNIEHIPFKADAEIINGMSTGSVHMGMATVQAGLAAVASGRAKAIAVTGSRRLASLPNVPSLSEGGQKELDGVDPYTYYGLAAPVGTPPAVIARLSEALQKVNASPEVIAHVREKLYAEPAKGDAESFRQFIVKDTAKWKAFAKHVKLAD